MLRLIAKRLALVVPVVLLVTLITFSLLQLTPGDPAASIAGETATPEELDRLRHELGLDKSVIAQYGDYLGDLVQFDMGKSIITQQSVSTRIADTLPVTVSLTLLALLFSVVIAIPAGLISALFRQRWPDRLMSAGAALGLAVPTFVVAFILLVPLALNRSLFPATGYVAFGEDKWEWFMHAALPALSLALVPAAELTRQIRGGLIDVLEQDYIRTVRAKGVAERLVVAKHAFRNASIPVVTIFGLQVGRILGGAVVVERVFAIPGFGSMAFDAVLAHDYPLIRAVVLLGALIVIASNLFVDVANGFLNPKLRAV